jgi:Tol biopolymer transport system component
MVELMKSEKAASRAIDSAPGGRYRAYGRATGIIGCAWLLSCGADDGDVTTAGALQPGVGDGGGTSGRRATPTPIVFRSDRLEAGVPDLYVMAPDGTGVTRLTEGGDFYLPQWSPDGASIAFRGMRGAPAADVGLVATDGSLSVLLTEGESPNLVSRPVNWSPDGQRIAFAALLDGGLRMSSIARSGGQQQTMLPNLELTALAWSRSEPVRIAYGDYVNAKNGDIWVADSDGSNPINLTKGQVYSPSLPRWSPDGKQVALQAYALAADGTIEGFASHSDGVGAPGAEVFVIDIESDVLTRLTYEPGDDLVRSWSPDGKSLLVASDRDGDVDIWLLPLDTPEQARNLIDDADAPAEDNDPDWDWGR